MNYFPFNNIQLIPVCEFLRNLLWEMKIYTEKFLASNWNRNDRAIGKDWEKMISEAQEMSNNSSKGERKEAKMEKNYEKWMAEMHFGQMAKIVGKNVELRKRLKTGKKIIKKYFKLQNIF